MSSTEQQVDSPKPSLFTEQLIEETKFSPSGRLQTQEKRSLPILRYTIVALLAMAGIVLWFLFTARSVVITTQPKSQVFEISGGVNFQWQDHLLMLPGNYRFQSSLDGYYALSEAFSVSGEQNQVKYFEFTPLPGHLKIITEPLVDFAITIDGNEHPIKQGLVSDIPAGRHSIGIVAENYFPLSFEIEIEGKRKTQSIIQSLVPAWADVSVNSSPEGVNVYLGEKLLGQTPLQAQLLQGHHTLRFEHEGYQTTQRPVVIKAGQAQQLNTVTMFSAQGTLSITSTPSGANVTYGDQYIGTTPVIAEVESNKQQALLLVKEGYKTVVTSIAIKPEQTINKHIEMQALIGKVKVNAKPEDALLYVDGRLMGRANQELSLPVKKQVFTIEKEGFISDSVELVPNITMAQEISVSLKTVEQAKWDNLAPIITAASGSQLKLFKPNDTFTTGASRREQGRRANEVRRKVQVTRAFYLGITEVTNKEFRQFQREHFSGHVKGNSLNGINQPAVQLTWGQAALFCNWLSERDNLPAFYQIKDDKVVGFNAKSIGYRLPTEAEWVWAARYQNGQMLKYPWGEELTPNENAGNFADISGAPILGQVLTSYNDKYIASAPVGSFRANAKGIFDLAGNVAEWIHDYYHIQSGLSLKTDIDPYGPENGDYHVIRGSSWAHGGRTELRLSYRDYGNDKRNDLGFRLARNAL